MTDVQQLAKENKEKIEMYQEDFEYIYDKFKEFENEIEELKELLVDRKAEIAEYIREMTDLKFNAYQELIEARRDDRTQRDIAEELGIDEAVLSRFKKEFKEKTIL